MKVKNLIFVIFLISCVYANEPKTTIEMRIAANPDLDKEIIAATSSSNEQNVLIDGAIVAKWFAVANEKTDKILTNKSLFTRKSPNNDNLELLVLINQYDITTNDIKKINHALDRFGNTVLELKIDDSNDKLYNLTGKNTGRYIAQIVNNRVYNVAEIIDAIRDSIIILGYDINANPEININEDMQKISMNYFSLLPNLIKRAILFFAFTLVIIVAGSILGKNSHIEHLSPFWTKLSMTIFTILGIGVFSVDITHSAVELQNKMGVFNKTVHIRIVEIILGVVLGGFIGYLCRFKTYFIFKTITALFNKISPKNNLSKSKYLNIKQKIALWAGVVIFIFILLFPPWTGSEMQIETDEHPEGYGVNYRYLGFAFILSSYELQLSKLCFPEIYYKLWFTLLLCVVIIDFAIIMYFKNPWQKSS